MYFYIIRLKNTDYLKQIISIKHYFFKLNCWPDKLQNVPVDYPAIINDALQKLEAFSEELTREIDSLIEDICRTCGKVHDTVMCRTDSGSSAPSTAGCTAANHHVNL